eukprot:jgi/Psemu1/322258/estExt_fgenesh1_pg.C_230019
MYVGRQLLVVNAIEGGPVSTCKGLGSKWITSFPESCVNACDDLELTMSFTNSKNINGDVECHCETQERPVCTDRPTCFEIDVNPGEALQKCQAACGSTDPKVTALDYVEFAGDPAAANKNQTHLVVDCSCDGGDSQLCGPDYTLWSDLTYLPSCTGPPPNTLELTSEGSCETYCSASNVFTGYIWNGSDKSCTCTTGDGSVLVCDDTKAQYKDGSGLGNPCYETIGVNAVDCSEASSETSSSRSQQSKTQAVMALVAINAVAYVVGL